MAMFRGCSLFLNSFKLSDSISYTPPEIIIDYQLFKVGGMNAAVQVDTGTKEMIAQYKLAGMDPTSFLFFGLVPGLRARLTVRRAFRIKEKTVFLHDELEGFINSIKADATDGDRGDVGQLMSMSVNYYRVSVDGLLPLMEINPILGVRKIYGVNVLKINDSLKEIFL